MAMFRPIRAVKSFVKKDGTKGYTKPLYIGKAWRKEIDTEKGKGVVYDLQLDFIPTKFDKVFLSLGFPMDTDNRPQGGAQISAGEPEGHVAAPQPVLPREAEEEISLEDIPF